MKGIQYNLKMKKADNDFITVEKLDMKNLCKNIKELFKDIYDIGDIKVNNQIVYNLMNRPNTCNPILRNFIFVEKI